MSDTHDDLPQSAWRDFPVPPTVSVKQALRGLGAHVLNAASPEGHVRVAVTGYRDERNRAFCKIRTALQSPEVAF